MLIKLCKYNSLDSITKALGIVLKTSRGNIKLSEVSQQVEIDERVLMSWESGRGLIVPLDLMKLCELYKQDKADAYLSYICIRFQFLRYCTNVVKNTKELPDKEIVKEKDLSLTINHHQLEEMFFVNGLNLKYNTYRQLQMVKPQRNYQLLDYFIFKTIYEGRFMGYSYKSIKKLYDSCLSNKVDQVFYTTFRNVLYKKIIDDFFAGQNIVLAMSKEFKETNKKSGIAKIKKIEYLGAQEVDIKELLKVIIRKLGIGVSGFASLVGSDISGICQCLKGGIKPSMPLLLTLIEAMDDLRVTDKDFFDYCLKNEMWQLRRYLGRSASVVREATDEQ